MAINNSFGERCKVATHMLVSMEIERTSSIRDPEAYKRARLPAVLREHRALWEAAYRENPTVAVDELVRLVLGDQAQRQYTTLCTSEDNHRRLREMPLRDEEVNMAGLAAARAALQTR
jgi:hypothetical protein